MEKGSFKFPSVSSLLDPNFGIPADITFHVMESIFEYKELTEDNEDSKEGVLKPSEKVVLEIGCHKMHLGLCSPVLRKQFYGEEIDNAVIDIIPIRETTKEAFKTLIEYIYSIEINWASRAIEEMFEVFNLAEKYQIWPLKEDIKRHLKQFPMKMENVMEVASLASRHQFPDISSAVLLSCAAFLKSALKSKEDLLNFATVQSTRGEEAVAMKLLSLMTSVPDQPDSHVCAACGGEAGLVCTRCFQLQICSQQCLDQFWPKHQKEGCMPVKKEKRRKRKL